MSIEARVVACPTCGKSAAWSSANAHRPFCSERCRQIDLGAWAEERYRVPDESEPNVPGPEDTLGRD